VFVIVLLAFAACGDDGEDTGPPPNQPPTETPGEGATSPPDRGDEELTADPALLEKSLGTTENIDPIVEKAIARAGIELSPEDRELALRCWRNQVCETGRGTLTVALADGFGENVWRRITHMEFVLQALSYPEVARIIYVSAQGDPAKAISDMRSLIAQGVDIIATFPDSGEALLPAAREATQAGIIVVPYIAGLGGTPGEDYLTFVAEDLCELGRQFAEFTIQNVGEGGNAVFLGGTPGNQLSQAWQSCAEPDLQDAGFNILGKADTNWTQEGTFQAMSGFLSQYSDIDAILYEYSDGFRGGVRAYQSANRPLDLVLTLRTDEQGLFCDWEEAGNPNFKIFFSTGGTFQSRIALTAAIEHLNGEEVPDRVVVPFKMRQVEEGMCDPNLPDETPVSTLVPNDLLAEMFR
jgi:ABC-type sugar transport system substrate-binding protein